MHTVAFLAQLAASAAVSGLWQGTLLAAAVWLCLRLVPRATAALRFTLWTAVLLVVAVLPLLESIPSAHPSSSPILQAGPRWSLALAALWLTLSLLRAASLGLHAVRLWSLHRHATPVAPQPSFAPGGRPVQLCTSAQLDRPGVIGFFSPRVLIPAWLYPQLTPPELEQIVLHEREHLRRRDDWLNLLQKLALVLFPLNPILVCVERLLCRERELSCDDGVLRRTHAPRTYASTLATLAERSLTRRGLSLALSALGNPAHRSELGRRVHRILGGQPTASPLHARALTAAVALVLAGGSATLARCPQLISFAADPQPLLAATPQAPFSSPKTTTMRPVVYAATRTSHARILQASFSLTPRPRPAQAHRIHLSKPTAVPLQTVSQQAAAQQTSLQLTAWPDTGIGRIVTLSLELPTYTAIRVEGGWLLLQM